MGGLLIADAPRLFPHLVILSRSLVARRQVFWMFASGMDSNTPPSRLWIKAEYAKLLITATGLGDACGPGDGLVP